MSLLFLFCTLALQSTIESHRDCFLVYQCYCDESEYCIRFGGLCSLVLEVP